MTYAPPPPAGGYSDPLYPEPRRIAGLAVASLVFSLILCIPFATAVIGLLLGIAGLVVASKPNRSGRGVAIAGIVIAVVGILGWSYISYSVYTQFIAPVRTVTEFSKSIAQGDATGASHLTAPPFNNDDIPALITKVHDLGDFQGVQDPNHRGKTKNNRFRWTKNNGRSTFGFAGTFEFANGRQHGDIELSETDNGWRITKCVLDDVPGSTTRTTQATMASPGEPPTPPAAPAVPEPK